MASQRKKKQSIRFRLPWNPISALWPKASSSKPTETPPKTSTEAEEKPSPQRASPPTSVSPSPVSSPPQSQQQQQPSPRRPSPVSSPSPPRPEEEYPTPSTAVSPAPSQAAPQPELPALTQEVSQSPLLLLTEKPEKTIESESPTRQEEILSRESQPTQVLEHGESDSDSVETRSQSAQDLEDKTETLAPTNGTISKETPLIDHETESMQEKTQVHPETVASTHPSQLPEIQETEIEPKEITKPSELKQADEESEKVAYQQAPVEERPKVNEETITKNLEVTEDRSPISQESNIVDEASKEEQPKVDPEPHQPTKPPLISIEEPKDIKEPDKSSAEPDSQSTPVLPETTAADFREEENKKALRDKEHTALFPVIPQASPILGDSLQKENGERSNLVEKIKIKHSKHVGSEQGLSIITLAGENNGASMHIGHETLNETGFWRGYKIDEHPSAERNGKNKAVTEKSSQIDEALPLTISINSNVQSINNSVLSGSSCSEEDPGVYLTFSSKPTKTVDSESETRSLQTLKGAFNTAPSQTLIHQQNIKE